MEEVSLSWPNVRQSVEFIHAPWITTPFYAPHNVVINFLTHSRRIRDEKVVSTSQRKLPRLVPFLFSFFSSFEGWRPSLFPKQTLVKQPLRLADNEYENEQLLRCRGSFVIDVGVILYAWKISVARCCHDGRCCWLQRGHSVGHRLCETLSPNSYNSLAECSLA